jgi:hypothetical protein
MLPAEVQELVDRKISGTDILHGYMKNALYEAEQYLEEKQQIEEDNDYSDAMESMDRTYAEGYLDALMKVNSIIIDLTYALEARNRG